MSGLSEGLSLASVIPVLNAISNPRMVLDFQIIGDLLKFFNLTSEKQIVVSVVLIFTFCFCASSAIRTINIWINNRFSALAGHDISIKVFKSIIFIPYEKQILLNSSEEINALILHIDRCIILFLNVASIKLLKLLILFFCGILLILSYLNH